MSLYTQNYFYRSSQTSWQCLVWNGHNYVFLKWYQDKNNFLNWDSCRLKYFPIWYFNKNALIENCKNQHWTNLTGLWSDGWGLMIQWVINSFIETNCSHYKICLECNLMEAFVIFRGHVLKLVLQVLADCASQSEGEKIHQSRKKICRLSGIYMNHNQIHANVAQWQEL